ncbi:MAG: hypothetical protein KDA91_17805 [Planctomycetaceae bacterium]|nr:hypothetical protein [Planctomycetaceae bacterium]
MMRLTRPAYQTRPRGEVSVTPETPTEERRDVGRRGGITLLEVLIATVIFMSSLAVILQLLKVGQDSELMSRLQAEAIMRCEAKMAEVLCGAQELTSATDETFPDNEASGTWKWSLESLPTSTTGLLQVTVQVKYVVGDDAVASFRLHRYMRDPQIFIDAALSTSESDG